MRVVFPAPFSPRRACTSPSATSNVTSSFATMPGNRFVIPRIATAALLSGRPLSCVVLGFHLVRGSRRLSRT